MLVNLKVTVVEQSAEGLEADVALRTDIRSMESNAGHQEELGAMLDQIVKTVKVELAKHARNDFTSYYVVMVNRFTEKPEPATGPDPRD